MTIEEYFSTNYILEKEEIRVAHATINKVLPIFKDSISAQKFGWEYVVEEGLVPRINYSTSTSAMILYVLGRMKDIIVDINGQNPSTKHITKENKKIIDEYFSEQVMLLAAEVKQSFDKKKGLYSGTFGINDVFTLGWSYGVLKGFLSRVELSAKNKTLLETSVRHIKNAIKEKLTSALKEPDNIECLFSFTDGDKNADEHVFPLLRAIHLYRLLLREDTKSASKIKTEKVKPYLIGKIHYQLSLSEIPNSNFDASELVFALEGVLVLDQTSFKTNSINLDLVNRVFEVIKQTQNKSPYWRPLKPFVITPQGLGLLPLSVEIANSLLRICLLLERLKIYFFDKYINLFKNYSSWLQSRLVEVSVQGRMYCGWHSEHINKAGIIHTWETIQVVHYLGSYSNFLQNYIARTSLDLSKLQVKKLDQELFDSRIFSCYWDFVKDKYEPFRLEHANEEVQVYESIGKKYIDTRIPSNKEKNENYSMLLYGPPGTGKTTIAEKIAETLQWPLIVITPSDFLIGGGDTVELRAKMIFHTLLEQQNVVVLFDEIDRLVLDRDSKFYQEQGDVFQFMTPSMLVKIRDLRDAKNSIFIVCTNYDDRIDPAIKRSGRIDNKYLVLPYNKEARRTTVSNIIKEEFESLFKKTTRTPASKDLATYLDNTALMTFGELRGRTKKLLAKFKDNSSADKKTIYYKLNNSLIEASSIQLNSYISRFKTNDNFKGYQEPFKEFLMLLNLQIESGYKPAAREVILDIAIQRLLELKIDEDYKFDTKDVANDSDINPIKMRLNRILPEENLSEIRDNIFTFLLTYVKMLKP